ncbi:MAG: PilZ domain-containing protein [Spirochaetales bacterium]|nr:PilZ domain-containing protein [Spirochaetales bacterium]
MKERRKYIRFNICQAIEVSFSRETYLSMEGVNISETGMLCRSQSNVETGSRLFLMFNFPEGKDAEVVRCEGIVVRCQEDQGGYRIGIQFSTIEEEDVKRIKDYSKKALEKSSS